MQAIGHISKAPCPSRNIQADTEHTIVRGEYDGSIAYRPLYVAKTCRSGSLTS